VPLGGLLERGAVREEGLGRQSFPLEELAHDVREQRLVLLAVDM
jgi:hypothetical protein